MKEINRYHATDEEVVPYPSKTGGWCKWSDVEALQKELEEVRAHALAAIWLIPEDESIAELRNLAQEAREVLAGKDKQTIARLQDELARAQEAYQLAIRPHIPGVNKVHGFKSDNRHVGYALMITSVRYGSNGGLEIEVQLP